MPRFPADVFPDAEVSGLYLPVRPIQQARSPQPLTLRGLIWLFLALVPVGLLIAWVIAHGLILAMDCLMIVVGAR
jgi:hypothetical protein